MEPHVHAAWVIAVIAGVLSFVSPCVLPLIPGYLSMVSGLSADQLEQRTGKHLARVFVSCVLFAVGLCIVFIPMGFALGEVGRWLGPHLRYLNIVLGFVVAGFGLFMMNVIKLPFLYQDRRVRVSARLGGLWAAPLLGMAFGAGWSPCLGPWIGALSMVASNQPPLQAALLFAIYGASLGACLVAVGMLFAWAMKAISFFQRQYRVVELVSGSLLVTIGLLMITGEWARVSGYLLGLVQ